MTTFLLTLTALAAALLDGSLLELQRGGDAWRVVTCHFTHFTHEQLAWDALALLALGIVCERRYRAAFHATLLASIIVIPLAVLAFDPRIATYRGLSGIDSALFALLVVSTRNRILGAAFLAKIAFETVTGGAVFVGDITAVPVAHVAGAVVGAIVALVAQRSGIGAGRTVIESSNSLVAVVREQSQNRDSILEPLEDDLLRERVDGELAVFGSSIPKTGPPVWESARGGREL